MRTQQTLRVLFVRTSQNLRVLYAHLADSLARYAFGFASELVPLRLTGVARYAALQWCSSARELARCLTQWEV